MSIMHRVTMGAATVLLALAGTAQAGVREGVDAWRSGDYALAISEWQPLADAGDPDAQFNLGQAYKLGHGVPQDMERARDLFNSAAQQGHLQAEANYGLILFQEGNRQEAMPYIARAANRGEPRAQYIYGTAMFNGDLAPRDWPRAYAMMTNASGAGISQATRSLRQMDTQIPLEQREEGRILAAQMQQEHPTTQVAVAPPPPSTPAPAPRPTSTFTPVPVPAPVTYPPVATAPPVASPVATPVQQPPVMVTQAPPAAPPAAAPAARTGDWRIQLGSFRERPRAETLWRRVTSRESALANLQPYLVRAGPYTRLQAGSFRTRAEAQRACSVAIRAGSECITVRRR